MDLRDSRSPRVPFARPVRVRTADGRGPSRRLWALNLSVGGMFIRTADPPPLGMRVRVEIEWATTVIPLAEGEVMWSRGSADGLAAGFGLRFIAVDPPTRSLLEALVRQNGGTAPLREAREARDGRDPREVAAP
jgi:uncharacterized protein (TIGR02266 family)